jgi:exonuclease SbcC
VIPCRVELTDFLSHRCADEPVVFDFDGAVLWSVSGDNGAGKSAIFDAITWTLFNEHRGGGQNAQRLISHGAETCSAAFVFALDGERYRVERSLRRRGAAKRAAYRWDEDSQAWEEIDGTASERGFERWREDLLGLSYPAFTQSALLLQGDSDRLIRAGSRERFEILAQLVDLSSYMALERLAKDRAAEARGVKSALRQDLDSLAPVDADERSAATAELERLTSERTTREDSRQAQAAILASAVEHERLGQRLAATRGEIDVAERVLAEQREQAGVVDPDGLERKTAAAEQAAAAMRTAAADAGRRADALRRALPAVETAALRRLELGEIDAALAATGTSADAQQALEDDNSSVADIRRVLGEAREAERELSQRLATLDAAVGAIEHEIAEMRAGHAEAVCSRCGQEVPEGQRETHIAHAESQLADKAAERDSTRAALTELAATRAAAERAAEAKLAERSRLELARERAGELEKARGRAKRAATAALKARALTRWDDERAANVIEGPLDRLEPLLDELRAEGEALDAEADRLAGEADKAAETAATARQAIAEARERQAALAKAQADVRERLAALRGAAATLAHQLDELTPEQRVPVAEAEAELERRASAAAEIAQLVEQAQAQLRDLDRREQTLREKHEDLERAERAERLATRLATLLGRQGLQGQLLVHACRTLETLANETLHALTGGTLSLEIRPDEHRGRDEITISARDLDAGGERTDAAFLSGSEKFRVCVAMAAAIGKYASGRTTIESLIVDEGFGSLDEAGRDEMIDELQRLAGLLKRVIVVSHQGEFRDRARFPHGYRLRRTDRTTEVERYL